MPLARCQTSKNATWGQVTYCDLVTWPLGSAGRRFLEICQIVGWTAMANLAALRAAVFSLSAKNHTGGGGWNQPPAGARVNADICLTVIPKKNRHFLAPPTKVAGYPFMCILFCIITHWPKPHPGCLFQSLVMSNDMIKTDSHWQMTSVKGFLVNATYNCCPGSVWHELHMELHVARVSRLYAIAFILPCVGEFRLSLYLMCSAVTWPFCFINPCQNSAEFGWERPTISTM